MPKSKELVSTKLKKTFLDNAFKMAYLCTLFKPDAGMRFFRKNKGRKPFAKG
jgi:hypothetical protein